MTGLFFQTLYFLVVSILLWQAFRVMSKGFLASIPSKQKSGEGNNLDSDDRTGRLTVHPELLDHQGRITDEELLTVRFSGDTDPPHSSETSAE